MPLRRRRASISGLVETSDSMWPARKIAETLLPSYVVNSLRRELALTYKRFRYSRSVRSSIAGLTDYRVNIGCGPQPTPGWINFDVYFAPGVSFWDCRRGLPFADNSVTAIYLEHVFEHFDPDTEAKPFLRECMRCLRAGGVLRIVVPDAGAYLRAYNGGWESLAAMRPLVQVEGGWQDGWLRNVYRTKMEFINAVFRQDFDHKYAYDAETLALFVRQAGFSDAILQTFGRSADPDMAKDSEARRTESLYIEGIK